MRIATAALLSMAIFAPPPCWAESAAEACDRLAAEPGTLAGVAGVELKAIDAAAASAACAAALEAEPGEARFAHQYARALERAGQLEEARRLYGWAAADGFAPAATALERLAGPDLAQAWDGLPEERADRLAGLAAVLNRYLAALPGDPADPLTVLAEVGTDPAALFAWVAGNTRLVAYHGMLRGASGVLLDRAGNSLDRALLLASLLRHAGQEVRLAHATLSDAQAQALLPSTGRDSAAPALPPLSLDAAVALFAADPRLDRATVQEAAADAQRDAERSAALFSERQAVLQPALASLVGERATEADRSAQAAAIDALSDHFWVQLRTGQGWRDLDPDHAVLGTLVPSETLAPDAIPEALRHSVTLRVVLELQDVAGRREETLLTWDGHPAELVDRPIVFSHVPRALAETDVAQILAGPDALQGLRDALDRETAWMPLFEVGDEAVVEKLFTADGLVATADVSLFTGTGRSIGDLFSDAGTLLEGGELSATESALPTAEWLEIEIRVPGAPAFVQRRTVFDLLGPAARAAGSSAAPDAEALRERALLLLGQTQILVVGAMPSELQQARLAGRELAGLAERLLEALAVPEPPDLDALPATAAPPLLLYDFLTRRLAAGGTSPNVTAASPTVVLQHLRIRLAPDQTLRSQVELDIVHHAVAVVATRAPFLARLGQGVADTILEALPFEAVAGVRNAAKFHAEDLAAGRAWTIVALEDLSRLAAPGVPPDYRARIEADLHDGFVVVAPADLAGAAAAGRLAWWRIDPGTGTTLGMLDDGAGAVMVEYQQIINAVTPAFCAFFMLGAFIGDPVGLTAMVVCAVGGGLVGALETMVLPGALLSGGIGVSSLAVHLLRHGI